MPIFSTQLLKRKKLSLQIKLIRITLKIATLFGAKEPQLLGRVLMVNAQVYLSIYSTLSSTSEPKIEGIFLLVFEVGINLEQVFSSSLHITQ